VISSLHYANCRITAIVKLQTIFGHVFFRVAEQVQGTQVKLGGFLQTRLCVRNSAMTPRPNVKKLNAAVEGSGTGVTLTVIPEY